MSPWWYHMVSTVVVVVLLVGLYYRNSKPQWHWKIMVTAFVMDVGLVLAIELNRGAIEKATTTDRPLLLFHIGVSVGVLLLYLCQGYLGRQLLRGRMNFRATHRNTGIAFIVFRGLNYVTSFMV